MDAKIQQPVVDDRTILTSAILQSGLLDDPAAHLMIWANAILGSTIWYPAADLLNRSCAVWYEAADWLSKSAATRQGTARFRYSSATIKAIFHSIFF